jgi:hypothetical protein
MPAPRRHLACFAVLILACLPMAEARKKSVQPAGDERARAIQALNRLTFGPRPGDVERVLAIGVDKWIDEQLHPNSIDDHALDLRLAPFRTLRMSTIELAENFPAPAVIRQVADGKQALPSDPQRRAVYETQLMRYREKQGKKTGSSDEANPPPSSGFEDKRASLLKLAPDLRMQTLLTMTPEDRTEFLAVLKGGARDEFLQGMSPEQRENVIAMNNPQQAVVEELTQAKILRALTANGNSRK